MFPAAQYLMGAFEVRRHDYSLFQVMSQRDVVLTLESPGIKSTLALFTRDGAPGRQRDGDRRAGGGL